MDTVRGVGSDSAAASADASDAVGNGEESVAENVAVGYAGTSHVYHYVTAFAMGDYAARVCAADLTMETVVARILAQLESVFGAPAGTARRQYLGALRVDWANEPYTRGAYSCPTVGEPVGARAELAKGVGGCLYFAGEATNAQSMMTAHAGIEAGHRAAEQLLRELPQQSAL